MSSRRVPGWRRIVAVICAVVVSAAGLQSLAAQVAAPAHAADDTAFQAGDIIDDGLFWDGNALSVAQIQAFLVSKEPTCATGYTCLKDYHQTTTTVAATPMCSQYDGAANESAATIIARVAETCGVSPKVILVTLQKEQGLVTSTAPGPGAYRSAMGAGCPDTAGCDANYYGFFNQVHYGSYLFRRYTQPVGTGAGTAYTTRFDLRYPVGQTTPIPKNPNAACGTIPVSIQNEATHALYIYTPYTPDQAALNAGYGLGGSCSSYGNRNFYNYFVDWFGTVRGYDVASQFTNAYTDYGGAPGFLEYPTSPYTCNLTQNGCYQAYDGGWIVQGPSGIIGVPNPVLEAWSWYGRDATSILGFPSGPPLGLVGLSYQTGSYTQAFQDGTITVANGVPALTSTTDPWYNALLTSPWLGASTQAKSCTLAGGACYQVFQNGWIVKSAAGTFAVPTATLTAWNWYGKDATTILGFPSGAPSADPTAGNYTQTFQDGTITVTNGSPALTSTTDPWYNALLTSPWLGASTQAKSCTLAGGACYQVFQNGWIVQSAAGTFAVPAAVLTAWNWYGRDVAGILGFPSSAPSANPATGTYAQTFQKGLVTVTSGTPTVSNFTDPWYGALNNSSWLGSSTQAKSCTLAGGACYQAFQNGWIVQSSAGTFAVPTSVLTAWGWYGRDTAGILGYPSRAPSANPTTGNYTQSFQNALVTVTNGNSVVSNITNPWLTATTNSFWLGTQTRAVSCTLKGGACYEVFQNGWIVQSTAGTFAIPTTVLTAWGWYGRDTTGVLGYPTAAISANPATGNYTQPFQGGTVTVIGGNPAVTLH